MADGWAREEDFEDVCSGKRGDGNLSEHGWRLIKEIWKKRRLTGEWNNDEKQWSREI